MLGKKTGGRIKGVSFNKPKVPKVAPDVNTSIDTDVTTTVAATVATAGGGGAPPGGVFALPRAAPAREAGGPGSAAEDDKPFPKYKVMATNKLVAFDRNPRTHSPAQVEQLVASMRRFGFTNPVLTDGKRGIIAGHGRLLAAQKLGMPTVPTLELSHLSEDERRAYVIADNKLALAAGWDEDLLRFHLGALLEKGFDLPVIGFDARELAALFGPSSGFTDPDEAPPVPEVPVSRPGDVWLLGRHRLVCGDSTTGLAVDAVLGGARPHLMVTDPPYGVAYDPGWRRTAGLNGAGTAVGKVENDDQADWRAAWTLFPGGVAYVWHGGLHGSEVADSLAAAKFKLRAQIVWVKTRPVISRGDYHWQHEPLFHVVKDGEEDHWRFISEHEISDYAVRNGATGHWEGSRKQSTVWMIEHVKSETGHSTQKPVECMKRPILNNSAPGEAVYDPFVGSGTTIIAAEMTGRFCLAIELMPGYVDVSVKRWQAFVGQVAVLEATGRTFAETEAARAAPARVARVRPSRSVAAA